jgi:peptide/nickel transport system permease protein
MRRFILQRLFYSVITLWLLTLIVFVVVRFTGDPAVLMSDYPGVRPEDLAALRTQWGLDEPYLVQYGKFISNVVQGDFGRSFQFNMPVREIYFRRLPTRCNSPVRASSSRPASGFPWGFCPQCG